MSDLTTEAIRLAMGMEKIRTEYAAQNISSANIPGAHGSRVSFSSSQRLLEQAASTTTKDESKIVQSLISATKNLKPSVETDSDANTIDYDDEIADLTASNLKYQAYTESLNRHFGLMRLAISGRN